MAHVQKRGTRWLATYKGLDGNRHSKRFDRKIDGERWVAEQTVDVIRRTWIDPAAGRITFGEYARTWIEQRPIRDSTRSVYRSYYRHMRELHAIPIVDLLPATIRTWQTALGQRLSKSNARIVRGVASSIVRDAVLDRLIPTSPFTGVKAPPPPDRVLVEPLPLTHVFAVHDAITARYAAAVTVGQGVGLRRGEAFGLTVDRLDFLRRTIKVDRQLLGSDGGRPVFGPPKTAASSAVVPVAQAVLDELAAHIAAYPPGPDGLLFTAVRGGPVARGKVGAAWRDAEIRVWAASTGRALGPDGWRIPSHVEAAWKDAHPNGHGRRYHDLRHVFASTLIAGGASVVVVQRLMRHQNAEETLRTYSHMWPAEDETARTIIDTMLARDVHEDVRDRPEGTAP